MDSSHYGFSTHFIFAILLTSGALIAACGENADDPDVGETVLSPAEEACLHAQEDTPIPRTATSEAADASDDIGSAHRLHEISLPQIPENDDFQGYLLFEVEDTGNYALFTSVEIDVRFFDETHEPWAVESTAINPCSEIVERHDVELEAGQYVVRLGPSDEDLLYSVTERIGAH